MVTYYHNSAPILVVGQHVTHSYGGRPRGLGENPASLGPIADVRFNRSFMEGVIARLAKDDAKAQAAFTAARAGQEKSIQAQPNYGPALCVLGLIDAGLGRKVEALR